MSLVVARKIDHEVRIISDTKMMSLEALRQTPVDGGLKCIVTSPTCCVSFAGNAHIAKQALAPVISNVTWGRKEITSHLLNQHRENGCQTDFIVSVVEQDVHIDRISSGLLQEGLATAWIGDHTAFDAYQKNYHSDSRPQIESEFLEERFKIASHMADAFGAVIADPSIPSVDDFSIGVTNRPAQEDGFRYLGYSAGYGYKTVDMTTERTSLLQTLGAEGGSYNYSLLVPTSAGIGAVAVYILEARLGALFYPARSWRAIPFKDLSIVELTATIHEQFGIAVDGVRIEN